MAPQVIAPRPMQQQQQTMVQLPPGFTIPPGMVLVQKEGHLILLPHSALQQLRPATPGAAPQFRLPPIHQPPGTHVIARSVAPTIIKQISPGQTVASTQPTPLQPQQPVSVAPTTMATSTATAPVHRPPVPVQAKVIQPPTVISAPPATATFSTATLTRPPTPTTPVMVTSAGSIRPLTSPTTVAITAALPGGGAVRAAAPTLVMTPELMENVKKCKNFLSTLVKLASTGQQSPETAHNVKDLVQSLLDGKIEPEEFTSRLQKELKSSPQPYLVPFLKKSLPALRQMNKNLQTFPAATCSSSAPAPTVSLSTIRPTLATGTGLGVTTHTVTSQQQQQLRMKQLQALSGAQGTVLTRPTTSIGHMRHIQPGMAVRFGAVSGKGPAVGLSAGALATSTSHTASTAQKGKFKDAGGGTFKDDDDINDVASMAGVNINEESAHIAATGSDTVGTQIRSCRDEAFLSGTPLLARMQDIAKRHGVSEVPPDAVSLMSHAAQERLRGVIEKLTVIAQHRLENMKEEERYEPTNDARSQLKFFEQLDRLEKQRKDEQEREILLRAAKSRSRQEDPEQARLKQKAKEMQQAELAQMRQRDANLTALAAIGPRKKRKIDSPSHGSSGEGGAASGAATAAASSSSSAASSSSSSLSQAGGAAGAGQGPSGAGGASGTPAPRPFSRQRITRVNLRDLVFYLEQEREGSHSLLLFQALFK
ncbi:transcription initiation factor TFIID subunit 4-like [Lethenteron reissneri]|uniref:transcription initiation factor TFIID subunit 4-like n=1 Tax=Lethenteron reissneri TaxID=7753 RepID=UPI002AB69D38|nr:transcription initiation factor TFIID subunit 4-like [Lethenteron reissneri]